MRVKFHNAHAMAAMTRPVVWTQDKSPHRRGTFPAAILQGESQSMSAGPTVDGILADPWNVMVAPEVALVADIAVGDTLDIGGGVTLSVQQVTRTPFWWQIRCTANERASNGG